MVREKPNINELIHRFKKGEKFALARLISLIENNPVLGMDIFKDFDHLLEKSYIIGITGPPGAGKSTLVDILIKKLIDNKKKVGIISVDPTSPNSGGAFLGDRIRLKHIAPTNPALFMRSVASRGSSGGLSRAVFDISLLLEAFGIDIIIIETVGAGQGEVDIFNMAYTTVVISVPGLGDHIQVQKAGIIEIANIQVVNKKDLGGDDVVAELELMLDNTTFKDSGDQPFWRPPVLMTNSLTGEGVDELIDEIWKHKQYIEKTGILENKKRNKIRNKIMDIVSAEIENYIKVNIIDDLKLEEITSKIERKEISLYEAAYGIFKGHLRDIKKSKRE
ncbi:MAG: methylmalonyl Co-A mutase-associated GTPase MeaB [Promethearchaeota archaeon]